MRNQSGTGVAVAPAAGTAVAPLVAPAVRPAPPAASAAGETPWASRWAVVRELAAGGQGNSLLVRRAGAAAKEKDPRQFVLKTLRESSSPERRAAMHHQVAALRTLDHPGVARFVESNSDQFVGTQPLYVVTEYVPGRDLEAVAGLSPLAVPEACSIVRGVLETLKFCHGRGVIHRDVRPGHVVVREGRDGRPVLLDVGLSFNRPALASPDAAPKVASVAAGLARRNGRSFIRLPEDYTRGADKKTDLSDMTQCVGLLFFLLTSEYPGDLADERGARPHERDAARRMFKQLDPPYRDRLTRILDVGFSDDPSRRWQSIDSLADEITHLKDPSAAPPPDANPLAADPVAERARAIRARLGENPELTRQQAAERHGKSIVAVVTHTMEVLNRELGDVLSVGLILSRPRPGGYKKLAMNFIFTDRLDSKHRLECALATSLANKELALVAECMGQSGEVVRVGLHDPDAGDVLKSAVENFLMATAERFARGAV